MKFTLLSGAYKNAGDHLIVQRCKDLLRYVYPDCEIYEYPRNIYLDEYLEDINQTDCVILGGGPAYGSNMYPDTIRLVRNLDDIKVPIFALGLGWWGITGSQRELESTKFSDDTLRLLKRMEEKYPLPSRDWMSYEVLQNNGIQTKMTGCTAWYNLPYIEQVEPNGDDIKTICISDPVRIKQYPIAAKLVRTIRRRYPEAKVKVVFHRGMGKVDEHTNEALAKQQRKLLRLLEKENCEYVDIAFSANGLEQYDKCDLHIGFRVHAHIYNLSVRNRSILIEEDSRGTGVNEALGLTGIKAYKDRPWLGNGRIYRHYMLNYSRNHYAMRDVKIQLDRMEANGRDIYKNVFEKMRGHFKDMISYIEGIQKAL